MIKKNRKYIKIDVLDKETGGKYKTLDDIEKAVTILSDILTNKIWKKPEFQKRALVT